MNRAQHFSGFPDFWRRFSIQSPTEAPKAFLAALAHGQDPSTTNLFVVSAARSSSESEQSEPNPFKKRRKHFHLLWAQTRLLLAPRDSYLLPATRRRNQDTVWPTAPWQCPWTEEGALYVHSREPLLGDPLAWDAQPRVVRVSVA